MYWILISAICLQDTEDMAVSMPSLVGQRCLYNMQVTHKLHLKNLVKCQKMMDFGVVLAFEINYAGH